jgi:hypothetical protein
MEDPALSRIKRSVKEPPKAFTSGGYFISSIYI